MPTLSRFFLIYTDGARPRTDVAGARGASVAVAPLDPVVLPGADTPLFGPHAQALARFAPRAAWLVSVRKEVRGPAGTFYADAHAALRAALEPLEKGILLDVLRLWPLPLTEIEALPDDPFAEDLLSVGFHEQGGGRFRAETYGLAALGQRELTFEFKGRDLVEEATLLCAHLADYVMEKGRRVDHGHALSFGFDKLVFQAPDGGGAEGCFRGWHPPFVQRVLPQDLFPGVGTLRALCEESALGPEAELTAALTRALEQRKVNEAHAVFGDAPHHGDRAQACPCAGGANGLVGVRAEVHVPRHSGWTFTCARGHAESALGVTTLGELSRKLPQIIRFLGLPAGAKVTWGPGGPVVDASRVRRDTLDPDAEDGLD